MANTIIQTELQKQFNSRKKLKMKLELNITEQELELIENMFDHFYYQPEEMDEMEKVIFKSLRRKFTIQADRLVDLINLSQEA